MIFSRIKNLLSEEMKRWQSLRTFELGIVITVSFLYGVFPYSSDSVFSEDIQLVFKILLLAFCVAASFRYLTVASGEESPVLQWPIKCVLSSLAGLVAFLVVVFVISLISKSIGVGGSLASSTAIILAIGLLAVFVFYATWRFLDEEINGQQSLHVLYAARVAIIAQASLAVWGYLMIAAPDAFSDVAATAIGPLAVGVFFGTVLVPPAIGLLIFQLAIFAFWLKRRIARRSLPLSNRRVG